MLSSCFDEEEEEEEEEEVGSGGLAGSAAFHCKPELEVELELELCRSGG